MSKHLFQVELDTIGNKHLIQKPNDMMPCPQELLNISREKQEGSVCYKQTISEESTLCYYDIMIRVC